MYSGYAVLPSSIVLVGMARRNDEHFAGLFDGKDVGNFGRTGILDVACGTTCQGEEDATDDIEAEAKKHRVRQRADGALDGAIAGIKHNTRSKRNTRGQGKGSKS